MHPLTPAPIMTIGAGEASEDILFAKIRENKVEIVSFDHFLRYLWNISLQT
jgi:hypothetical protein